MFCVKQSTCLQALFDTFAQDLSTQFSHGALSPFDCPPVLVQSPAMEKWLQVKLAQSHGIIANIDFPMPASYIWQLYGKILGDDNIAQRNSFRKEALTWRLMKLLLADHKLIPAAVKKILANHYHDGLYYFQFCQHMADLFDQYLVFRPHWINEWENAAEHEIKPEHWQAQLWRLLVATDNNPIPTAHRANYNFKSIKALQETQPAHIDADTVYVFGIASLPPQHLDLLLNLANHIDVIFYLQIPTEHFFSDIRSYKKQAWMLSHAQQINLHSADNPEDLHFDEGNPLLASLGAPIKDFIDQLYVYDARINFVDINVKPSQLTNSLLSYTQQEVKDMTFAGSADNWLSRDIQPSFKLTTQDNSILVHACYSPLRELQVLHNQLLMFFENDRSLQLEDVLIITPTPDIYAPLLPSVFKPNDPSQQFDYAVSDISLLENTPLAQSVITLLTLNKSRFKAPVIIDLLNQAPIYTHWNFNTEERKQLSAWAKTLGVRWAWDAQSKQQWSLPENKKFTWAQAIDSSLLGLMIEDGLTFKQQRAYSNASKEQAQLWGRWFEWLTQCHALSLNAMQAKPIEQWIEFFHHLFTHMLSDSATHDTKAKNCIISCLENLRNTLQEEAFLHAIEASVILKLIQEALQEPQQSFQLITGKINISSMLPMTGIPFKIICMLGLNEGEYPTHTSALEFNLIETSSKLLGDRSRRNEDAYQFLQAILAAQEKLHISYIGNNILDNSPLNPSSFVQELLYYTKHIIAQKNASNTHPIVIKHPLNGFSHNYFDGSNQQLVNFKHADFLAAQQTSQDDFSWHHTSFDFSANTRDIKTISLDSLLRFYQNTARHFAKNASIDLTLEDVLVEEQESLSLNHWTKTDLLIDALAALDTDTDKQVWIQQQQQAFITPEDIHAGKVLTEIWQLAHKHHQDLHADKELTQCHLVAQLEIEDSHLDIHINNVYKQNSEIFLPRHSTQKISSFDKLASFIKHVAVCASGNTAYSILMSTAAKHKHIPPIEPSTALELLRPYIEIYRLASAQYTPFQASIAEDLLNDKDTHIVNAYQAFMYNHDAHHEDLVYLSQRLMAPVLEYLPSSSRGAS